jgi:hypothetical protein
VWAISILHRREFQAHTLAGKKMPHYGVGSDLTLLDKEIKSGRGPYGSWACGLDEQTTKA